MLERIIHGDTGQATPLLIVHGLFGSARNWGAIAKRLSGERRVVAVDMRNHGASPWTRTHSYADMAADLAEVIAAEGQPMHVLGHSMGGKAAMLLALRHPDLVARLVIADIAPVRYGHSAHNRELIDRMLALPLADLTSRMQADALLAEGIPEPAVRAFLLQSLDLRADPPRWRLNLGLLHRAMDQITDWPQTGDVRFAGPTLFVSGAQSAYVRPEHRPAIRDLFPRARFVRIPQAGHWLHAEAPRPFAETVAVFLGAVSPDQPVGAQTED